MNVTFLTKTIDDRFSILELGSNVESMKSLLKAHVKRFLDKKANVTSIEPAMHSSEDMGSVISFSDNKGKEHTARFNLLSGDADEFFKH